MAIQRSRLVILAGPVLAWLSACSGTSQDDGAMMPAGSAGSLAGPGGATASGGLGSGGSPAMSGGAAGAGVGGAAGAGGSVNPNGGAAGAQGGAAQAGGGAGGAAEGGAAGAAGASGAAGAGGAGEEFTIPTIVWPSAECETQVAALLADMTTEEKAGQMVMALHPGSTQTVQSEGPGSVFAGGSSAPPGNSAASSWATWVDGYVSAGNNSRLNIPILFGIDAVHGHNKATGTVIFPHNAGLGSSRNPALVEEVSRITALEVAATGVSWTYAPVLSVSHDDRWGRVYESYGEDPELVGLLGAAATLGLQGRGGLGTGAPGIVACAKHFAGDGQATAGTSSKGGIIDRGDVQINEQEMRTFGIDPYLPAIQAGLGSIMVSDARWNGANMTNHGELVTDILKGELGFEGFVATDWNAAVDSGGGVVSTINAGVDMLMQPDTWQASIDTIVSSAGGAIAMSRIDDAARRILTTKCEAGLFGWQRDTALLTQVGSEAHRAVGRQAVRESLVLLQNESNVLPLTKGSNVWVGGSGADSMERQCGGWTILWQNSGGIDPGGTTIREAIAEQATVVGDMAAADVGVVVLSEPGYAEFLGDSASTDTLPASDFNLLTQLQAAGKPVVAIIVSGRPVQIADELGNADAWIAAWLPGTEGEGVADVLFGDYAPTGKLSHSFPRNASQITANVGDANYDPLFPYGHGLTY